MTAADPASRPVCVVTGSSSGIGAATAVWFARQGYDVVVHCARSLDAAERVAQQCRDVGAQALVLRADVARDEDCKALADEVRRRWGRVDTLVNSAGMTTRFADLKDLDALSCEDFQTTYRVNVIGVFQMSRAIAPLMRDRPGASIVNISSIGGRMGTGSSMAYAASKGALNTLTLSLARALAPGIRVNALLPGLVNGDWMRNGLGAAAFEQRRQRYQSRALLQSVIEFEDVAAAAYWLATGALKSTGQLIDLEAGHVLG